MHTVALIDCDCFFVSCERSVDDKLNNQPVCVVTGDNGCVVSRSKEAKDVGVKMGMPMFMAKQQFPEVIYKNARHTLYHHISEQVMDCLKQMLPEVEVVSVDEAYAELTSLDKVYKQSFAELAQNIKNKILQQTQIPVSIGIAPSKLLAKLASDKAKNCGGIFQIDLENLPDILKHTDINDVSGIGRSHSKLMAYHGVFSAFDFVNRPDEVIRKQMGIIGLDIKYELLGHYLKKVNTKSELPQSIQDTSVLPAFTSDKEVIKSQLRYHLHQACRRMRSDGCYCTIVELMLRTKDFYVVSDKIKLSAASDDEFFIAKEMMPLLDKIYHSEILYRSSGVSLLGLISKTNYQQELFKSLELKSSPLSSAWDELENKFGKNIIKNGWS